ncbi:MAG: glycogen/starch synthase, partial [Bacteroidia bacterium]|nr:glycogen/starch synthase [Bacteroidia bacterium]
MKKVLHVSTECFPAAKSGGLGDVVGALPIYQPQVDVKASVVIPYYDLPWFAQQKFKCKYKGVLRIDGDNINFEVLRLTSKVLEYPLYAVSLPGLFDRPSIYLADHGEGFGDEPKRNIGFQRAVVQWLTNKKQKFDIIHCHDHQSGLIPFFLKFVGEFERIRNIPTILTIHNAQYRGQFDWTDQYLLPEYDRNFNGWLDWDNCIHSLAAAVKLADRVTTVSPSYMDEITHSSGSLEYLFKSEATKCSGILNGIDTKAWDTRTDKFLDIPRKRQWAPFKSKNKELLCDKYNLNPEFPLISFIGRLAYEKGADLLADAVSRVCHTNKKVSFILLGSGDRQMEQN